MPPQVIPLTTEQRDAILRREEEAARADIERMRRETEQRHRESCRRRMEEIHDQEKEAR